MRTRRALADANVLAVDIGTGSARALLFDACGDVRVAFASPLRLSHPRPGWSEQSPDEIVDAVAEVMKRALREAANRGGIAAVSFSSQMYSVLATDRSGKPLTMSLPWTDARATLEADDVRSAQDARDLAAITGCPIQAVYPLSKIRWLRAHAELPDDAVFVSIKDYVLWQLTGRLSADRSTSSASGLMNIASGDWSELALDVAGIKLTNLPALDSPHAEIVLQPGCLLHDIGLPTGPRVVLGAGDAALSSVGAGAVDEHVLAINIGSSAAARRMIGEPRTDPSGRLWTYVVDEDHWITGGSIGSAGTAYDWAVDLALSASTEEAHAQAIELIGEVSPGADGLTFLPYFSGEQSPTWRPNARGAFVGISFEHERRHLLRAAIEGLVFALERVRQDIERFGNTPLKEVAVTGGVCRSRVVRQIIADVLELPVVEPAGHEGSARGAAVFAWLALGVVDSLEESARAALAQAPRTLPSDAAHAAYGSRFDDFVALADALGSERTGALS